MICRATVALALAFAAFAGELPSSVRQGDTIHISMAPNAASARFHGKTIKLFLQDGNAVGLMPIEVNHPPGPHELYILDAGGVVLHKQTITVEHVEFPTQNIIIDPAKKRIRPSPGELQTVAALRDSVMTERLWSEPFVKPTRDCMNSPFGVRRLHNGVATGSYHRGLDQRSRRGTPVHAITGGIVRIARMWNLHGGTIGIDHGQGVTSFYLHLSKPAAKEGARVAPGDIVGYVGSTGFANGPHLHWQLTVNGVPVNPHQWVAGIEPCLARPAPRKRKTTPKRLKNRRK